MLINITNKLGGIWGCYWCRNEQTQLTGYLLFFFAFYIYKKVLHALGNTDPHSNKNILFICSVDINVIDTFQGNLQHQHNH